MQTDHFRGGRNKYVFSLPLWSHELPQKMMEQWYSLVIHGVGQDNDVNLITLRFSTMIVSGQ
jgi:hypothetical protein